VRRQRVPTRRWLQAGALGVALTLATPSAPAAHEIPTSVMIHAFIRPEGDRLRLLVRVPLEAMRDIVFPLRGLGYLDLPRVAPFLHEAAQLWVADAVEMYEDGIRLAAPVIAATRVSLPSDRAFSGYDTALANLTGQPLPLETELPWQQAMLDVLLEYRITSDRSDFAVNPRLARLGVRTSTVLRFLPAGGAERAFHYPGDPGLVRLDPRWHHAALRFVREGFDHILDGVDHLLFVLCLVIPFRRVRPLVILVTSFTVAHSITLIAAASGLAPDALWFPPLIELLIALSIVYMAFENIVGPKLERRWIFAFAFGLVHGFGFSFILRDTLQFAGGHLATSLVAFNVGVELGQLFVLALAVPVLDLLFRRVVAERIGTILLSALIAHGAWHWMTDRASALREYQFQWPAFDLALAGSVMRALMLLLFLAGVVWGLFGVFGRLLSAPGKREPTAGAET
jgi:hypothetical protein